MAGVVAAQGSQDLGGRVQAVHRHCLGGGTQSGGDGHLVALGHPQPRGERADHAAEPGRVGEQRRGGVRAAPGGLAQGFRTRPPGGQVAS